MSLFRLGWADQYVDLTSSFFLPDDEWGWLYAKYPDLPKKADPARCGTCRGAGSYTFRDETHPCDCAQQLALTRHYLVANIGPLYHRLDWIDYRGAEGAMKHAAAWIERRERNLEIGRGLLFRGEFGRGKTMLAALIAKEMVKLGVPTFFVTFAEMIEMYTRGWGDDASRDRFERKVTATKVLVLDDLGKELTRKNNLPQSTFDAVLRQRVVELKPTILTTNLTVPALRNGYGGAIMSLLVERSNLVDVEGGDWRKNVQDREDAEADRGWRRPVF